MEFQDEKVHFQEIQFLRPSLIVKVTKKRIKKIEIYVCASQI